MDRHLSIRRQLTRSLTVSLVLLFTTGALFAFFFVRSAVDHEFDAHLLRTLRDFETETELTSDGRIVGNFHELRIKEFETSQPEGFYQLWDDTGTVIVRSESLPASASLPFRRLEDDDYRIEKQTLPDGRAGKTAYVSFPVSRSSHSSDRNRDSSVKENRVHLAVALSTTAQRRFLTELGVALFLFGSTLTVAMLFLVRRQIDRGCQPIDELALLTASISPDRLDRRLPLQDTPTELLPLVTQFNTLLDRLESSFEREKRLSASLAHELRTPLAELRALTDNALAETDLPELQENPEELFEEAREIGDRMTHLVAVLSRLHSARSGDELVRCSSVTVFDLLQSVVNTFRSSCERFDEKFKLRNEAGDATIETDEVLLRTILQHLIGNALTYAPADAAIECWVEAVADVCKIRIQNSTADLEPDDLARVAEPFWRKDPSRTESGKFGLGLTLVEAYSRLIGAQVSYSLDGQAFLATVEVHSTTHSDEECTVEPALSTSPS